MLVNFLNTDNLPMITRTANINLTWCHVLVCFIDGPEILPFQALYYCTPFREQLLEYYAKNRNLEDAEESLLTCLADLFSQVNKI